MLESTATAGLQLFMHEEQAPARVMSPHTLHLHRPVKEHSKHADSRAEHAVPEAICERPSTCCFRQAMPFVPML